MNSQQPHGGSGVAPYDRDREIEEQRHRDEARYRAMQHQEDMVRRDQDRDRTMDRGDREREREANDRYQATPRHSSAGSIPIHQPVASRIAGAIHSPGGLLANHNGNTAGGPPHAVGHSAAAPIPNYGAPPVQPAEHQGRPVQHNAQGNAGPQHQMFAPMPHTQPAGSQSSGPSSSAAATAAAVFGGPLPQQPTQQQQQGQDGQRVGQPGGAPFRGVTPSSQPIPPGVVNQGQQPILNVS